MSGKIALADSDDSKNTGLLGTRRRRSRAKISLTVFFGIASAGLGSSLDTLTVQPSTTTVGSHATITFTLTVGPGGFKQSGEVQIEFPARAINRPELDSFLMSRLQISDPDADGYVQGCVTTNGLDCAPPLGIDTQVLPGQGIARFVLLAGDLDPGDHIYMKYTGQMRKNAGTIVFKFKTDRDADNVLEPPADTDYFSGPTFTFAPEPAAYVQLTSPADLWVNTNGCPQANSNGCFDLAAVALDQYGNLAAPSNVQVTLSGGDLVGLPGQAIDFSTAPIQLVRNLRYTAIGFHKITGTASGGVPVYTHYSYVHPAEPVLKRYFGDTHFHTGTGNQHGWSPSIGPGDHNHEYTYGDQAYRFVRDAARLDFASLSEHDSGITAGGWAEAQALTEHFNSNGAFTTFRAYEWTQFDPDLGSHQIVLYRGGASTSLFACAWHETCWSDNSGSRGVEPRRLRRSCRAGYNGDAHPEGMVQEV